MKLVGLIGFAGSGKTSIAKSMTGWTPIAFADALKLAAAQAMSTTVERIEAEKNLFRPALVEIGRMARHVNPTCWIEQAERTLAMAGDGNYVFHDVRYANEVEAILERGGRVFYIHRPGVEWANDEERDSICTIFTNELGNAAIRIDNDSTPQAAAAAILEYVRAK